MKKGRKNKIVVEPTKLNPSEEELKAIKESLLDYYNKNQHLLSDGEDPNLKISNVLEECKNGWTCAPKTFAARVRLKTQWKQPGYQSRGEKLTPYAHVEQTILRQEIDEALSKRGNLFSGFVKDAVSDEELKFIIDRESFYRNEFEFNDSSDWALLAHLLTEELTQHRLIKRKLKDSRSVTDMEMSESYKRMINAQKALGITREQRENSLVETEGNIAQLSVKFMEKMKIIEKIRKKDALEEDAMQMKHDNKEGLAELPDDLAKAMYSVVEEAELHPDSEPDKEDA